ncbi:group II truncated hemoglobin [Alkalimonas collagenimarina]|uniref:Group II truncated hemoglobin n=1 Tax=Alkalimonas collagenimarina TaxID=400390 RepID=A0ABT9H125_9GAMM|nr:group II truncated hemoglobin [Alkalimonas collagenimarina]MDP4536983.1 group II truncated hemoglobin [Alkalimonas collagenimarina]
MTKQPTLFEWMGGREAVATLLEKFYEKVKQDDLLKPLFQHMADDHHAHVAMWFEEVLGGTTIYTEDRGGFKTMLRRHRGRKIQPEQRERWVALMLQTADEIELPTDPEFRSAFVAYIEWGSRRALANSQPDAPPSKRETVPRWGWGEAPPGTE